MLIVIPFKDPILFKVNVDLLVNNIMDKIIIISTIMDIIKVIITFSIIILVVGIIKVTKVHIIIDINLIVILYYYNIHLVLILD